MTALASLDGLTFIAGIFIGAAIVITWFVSCRALDNWSARTVQRALDAPRIPAPRTAAVSSSRKSSRRSL